MSARPWAAVVETKRTTNATAWKLPCSTDGPMSRRKVGQLRWRTWSGAACRSGLATPSLTSHLNFYDPVCPRPSFMFLNSKVTSMGVIRWTSTRERDASACMRRHHAFALPPVNVYAVLVGLHSAAMRDAA